MTLKLGTEIPGTSAEGNITTLWVPTIADIKRPTMAELEAGTDISNYVMLELGRPTHFYERPAREQHAGLRSAGPQIRRRHLDRGDRQHEHGARGTEQGRHAHGRRQLRIHRAPSRHGHGRGPRRRAEAHRRERQVRREEGPQPGREHHDPKRHPPVRASARLGVRNRRDRVGRGLTRLTIILPCGLSAFLSPHGTPSSPKGRETETRNAPWHWKSSASASRST